MDSKEWCLEIAIPESVKLGAFGQNVVKYIKFVELNKDKQRAYSCGAFFGSILYEDDEKQQISTKVIIKFLSPSPVYWIKAPNLTFSTEIAAYNKVLPYFSKFHSNILKLFPKFYYGVTSSFAGVDRAAVILQHMPDEYKLSNQVPFLDYQHLSLMMKEIGKFHACSYIAKHEDKIGFKHLVKNLHETFAAFYDVTPGFYTITTTRGIEPLKTDAKYRDKLNGILDATSDADEFVKKVLTPKNDKIDVICHGDFLSTNTLFKYDSKTGDPISVVFFDLANSRYASPITDIALPLYLQTDQKTRDLHWNELLDCYYDSMTQIAPIEYLPTKQEILEEFKENSVLGYITASYYLPVLMDTRKEEVALKEKMEASEIENLEEKVKILGKMFNGYGGQKTTDALIDIVKDMIDRSYI